ncbi:molybdopterin guanine dinucleotide synthesis [Octadecabacter sp. G9-8]|uniref:Molybdopterin guanine dinucleotide synthesis n=1 Tax=Octadecabacter dasysiphoniae TaxID=2909341 RepID=A0ABS9CVN1_9RHOB|nr:molybdopterin guanine dinucleotide synthesis [Octadecabacter dasysiphoniae]MCF2871213.1 molybdopterin guanine dinucleotide synthesis [Octadecabacter dasysiphoniae]
MDVTYDTIVTVDWSGGVQKSVRPSADAIWVSVKRNGQHLDPQYFRSRQIVEPWLEDLIEQELAAGRRLFIGFDFAFGYPKGFGAALTGANDPLAVWSWFEDRVQDAPRSNNRFDVASDINRQLGGCGPFWGCPKSAATPYLSTHKSDRDTTPFPEKRKVEERASGAFTVWQLAYPGAVGSQVFMGLPVLERLRRKFHDQIAVWPFEPLDRPVSFVEVWPSLFNDIITPRLADHPIKDAVQMHVLTELIAGMSSVDLGRALKVPRTSEGWIFGVTP